VRIGFSPCHPLTLSLAGNRRHQMRSSKMPIATVIDYPCRPKKELGNGDGRAGTTTLVELLKRDDQAALEPHVPACTNCPANARRMPFGCVGVVPQPIPRAAEQWALDRLQPPDAIGGALFLQAIDDFEYDGSATREFRAKGLFESDTAAAKELPENPFRRTRVTTDELFHPLLTPDGRQVPWQMLAFLMWLGSVKLDDAVPRSADDGLKLTRMEPAERPKRAKLTLGPSPADPGVIPVRDLLKALFVGWARDVELLVSA
jgi:hypothetical protein